MELIDLQPQLKTRLNIHLKNGELKLSGNPNPEETQAALDAAQLQHRVHATYRNHLVIQLALLLPLLMSLAGFFSFSVTRSFAQSQVQGVSR